MGVKRRNDDDECKHAAIRLVTVNGHGVSETARNLGINAHILSRWKRAEEARDDIIEYIELFYHSNRKHSYLGYLSPHESEQFDLVA
jgi:transposase InsO family protein